MRLYRQISSAGVGHESSASRSAAATRRPINQSEPPSDRAASTVNASGICQPTAPSMFSSMRRDSSTAYSIGSVFVIGSMKPFTIIAVACCSVRPRDWR